MPKTSTKLFVPVDQLEPEKRPDRPPDKKAFNGVVLGAVIVDGGTDYVDSTNLPTIGGTGPQEGPFNCKVDIVTTSGVVTAITINSGGIGYTLDDTLIVNTGDRNCIFKANPVST